MSAVPVLLYHSVDDDPPSWIAPFTVRVREFCRQLDALTEHGFSTVTATQLAKALTSGMALPERPVVLTFDDGFADFASAVVPALAARALTATLYVTTGALLPGAQTRLPPAEMLTWRQLSDLEAAGVEIGAHTVTHPQLDTVPRAVAWRELLEPKQELEGLLGHPIATVAYPHGYSDPAVRRLAREAGYSGACAVRNALSSLADDPYQIARLTVTAGTTCAQVITWLNGSGAPVAPFPERLRTRVWRTYRRGRETGRAIPKRAG